MKLSELAKTVGDENIEIQAVEGSMVRAQVNKHDGEITFATERRKVMALAGVGITTHVGLIVWLPVDRIPDGMNPLTKNE